MALYVVAAVREAIRATTRLSQAERRSDSTQNSTIGHSMCSWMSTERYQD